MTALSSHSRMSPFDDFTLRKLLAEEPNDEMLERLLSINADIDAFHTLLNSVKGDEDARQAVCDDIARWRKQLIERRSAWVNAVYGDEFMARLDRLMKQLV